MKILVGFAGCIVVFRAVIDLQPLSVSCQDHLLKLIRMPAVAHFFARPLSILFACSLTASCGYTGGPVGKNIERLITDRFDDRSAFSIQQVEQVPYASISAWFKGITTAMLVLAEINGDDRLWMSADRGSLTTRKGRLLRTVNLPQNMWQTDFRDDQLLQKVFDQPRSEQDQYIYRRQVDLSSPAAIRHGALLDCHAQRAGRRLLGQFGNRWVHTEVWHETCSARDFEWRFTNRFWVDQKGMVWKSEQAVTPELGALHLEILRHVGG